MTRMCARRYVFMYLTVSDILPSHSLIVSRVAIRDPRASCVPERIYICPKGKPVSETSSPTLFLKKKKKKKKKEEGKEEKERKRRDA